MKVKMFYIIIVSLFLNSILIFSSDRSDAVDLMNKCENNVKILEIPVKNFGDKNDLASYEDGLGLIKQGKVKLAQSKFVEAKAKFDEYLKLEYNLYGVLAPKYIQRTQQMIDKISEDLVDFVNQADVLKNFSESSRILDSAKTYLAAKNYPTVIQSCRVAKNFLFNNYVLLKKPVPKEYQKDLDDKNNKISQE
jgi:hypothetical protein